MPLALLIAAAALVRYVRAPESERWQYLATAGRADATVKLWSLPGGQMMFVACVHKDKAVLVGLHEVTGLRMDDGKPAWPQGSVRLPGGALPSGRGIHADSSYYLPTTVKKILQIDLESGHVASEIKTPEIPGNLIVVGGRVISQNIRRVEQVGGEPR